MSFSVTSALVFLAINIYLMTPYLSAVFLMNTKIVFRNYIQSSFQPIYFCYFIPIFVLFLLSFSRPIGLHWPIAFYTIFFLMIFDALKHIDEEKLNKIVRSVLYFSLVHLFIIFLVLAGKEVILSKFKFQKPKQPATIAMALYPQEIIKTFRDKNIEKGEFYLATESYSSASLLSYFLKKEVIVFGEGTHNGRHHDVTADFRKLEGKNILIFRRGTLPKDNVDYYQQFFEEVKIIIKKIKNAEYAIVLGYHFNYPLYSKIVLCEIKKKYYNIPDYLPYKKTFLDKYNLVCD